MKRLIEQTACPECDRYEAHDEHEWYGPSSRELTVDYEAAAIAWENQYDDMEEDGVNIHAIVDAALGGRWANLTSPETIEKAVPDVERLLVANTRSRYYGSKFTVSEFARGIVEAVLRSVEEGET